MVSSYPEGAPEDVDAAVVAATTAFPGWASSSVAARTGALRALADLVDANAEELARLATIEVGTPNRYARGTVSACSYILRNMAEHVEGLSLEEKMSGGVRVLLEPIGVAGAITPWNYPLYQSIVKLAPALGAGCTVVLKPSEVAPTQVFRFVELVDQAGILPPGVLNVISGTGPVVGEALASHPDVAMISLTGSTRAGARVSELAAQTIKRLTLELGGKSPNVVLPDVEDLQSVVTANVNALASNAGQTCTALTRLIVPRSRLSEAEEAARAAVATLAAGDPLEESTTIGPIVSKLQHQRVIEHIETAERETARVVIGGSKAGSQERGYFVSPTVFSDVTREMSVAQNEVFGPVLAIMPYDGIEEAVELANSTSFGLSGAAWGADPERAFEIARQIQSGMVHVNGAPGAYDMPFGGYKQSGNGRELGLAGLKEYYETKAVAV
ncbi:aldehyde dehydrogenase family protein [Arthrobacter sp. S2(2024)]|uniref:aldehyde dehydrogenase family protein n=1 Tax=Arthrobacter sp. S2(2024) TaxID=3111911 RepID=UPI002FC7B1B2